jgi:hypothetical protein
MAARRPPAAHFNFQLQEPEVRLKSLLQPCILAAAAAVLATPAIAESTNSTTFESWTNDTAVQYHGRIPRDVYLDEMGRRWEADPNHQGTREVYLRGLRDRWDTMDRSNRGLTPAEISSMTGKVDSTTSALPRTASGVQPGNMGPANSKGQ